MRKRYLICILSVFLLLCCTLQAVAAGGGYSFYCVRQKAHRKPQLEPEFAFIEDYDAYYIDRTRSEGDADKVVYLTFDAGYENGNVERILNTLHEREVPGAFFILKHFLTKNTDLVERMIKEGHIVCNHTAHHKNLANADAALIKREISELSEAYKELMGGEMPRYFRPPEGRFSREMLQCVQNLGYKTVFWSFAYADWDNEKQPREEDAIRLILDNLHNGAVLLLHPTSATNAAILGRVIDAIRAEGYRFGTLDELCAAR